MNNSDYSNKNRTRNNENNPSARRELYERPANRPSNNSQTRDNRTARDANGRPMQKTVRDANGRPVQKTVRDANGRPVQKTVRDANGRPAQKPVRDANGRPVKRDAYGRPVRSSGYSQQGVNQADDYELRARRAEMARRKKRAEERKRERRMRAIVASFGFVFLFIVLYALTYFISTKRKVTVEINEGPVEASDFKFLPIAGAKEVSGFDEIDYSKLGEYKVVIKTLGFKKTVKVVVEDTVSPKVSTKDVETSIDTDLQADMFVASVTDATKTTVSFAKKPSMSDTNTQTVKIKVTDEGGNETVATASLKLYKDNVPPVIEGVKALKGYVGSTIKYKEGIVVTDNMDPNPQLTIDNSQVDSDNPGVYKVIYIAKDAAGIETKVETTLTLEPKPDGYVEPDIVLAEAQKVLDEILTDGMSEYEKLSAIYKWCNKKISYVDSDYKESWEGAAYIAFTKRQGDCYMYFAAAKALLTQAGFENVDVIKKDTSHSKHFWNMVNTSQGWYHFDTTNFRSGYKFCLVTDKELDAYSKKHKESHNRDKSLYPATSEKDYVKD